MTRGQFLIYATAEIFICFFFRETLDKKSKKWIKKRMFIDYMVLLFSLLNVNH